MSVSFLVIPTGIWKAFFAKVNYLTKLTDRLELCYPKLSLHHSGADAGACDNSEMNPFMIAVAKNHLEVVKAMIKKDPGLVSLPMGSGSTVVHWALEEGHHRSAFFKVCFLSHSHFVNDLSYIFTAYVPISFKVASHKNTLLHVINMFQLFLFTVLYHPSLFRHSSEDVVTSNLALSQDCPLSCVGHTEISTPTSFFIYARCGKIMT